MDGDEFFEETDEPVSGDEFFEAADAPAVAASAPAEAEPFRDPHPGRARIIQAPATDIYGDAPELDRMRDEPATYIYPQRPDGSGFYPNEPGSRPPVEPQPEDPRGIIERGWDEWVQGPQISTGRQDGAVRDFAAGIGNGLTFNFLDEIIGRGSELGSLFGGENTDYETVRDQARATLRQSAEESPWAYGTGNIAGALPTMLVPVGSAPAAATRLGQAGANIAHMGAVGVGAGGLAGAGASEADTLGGVVEDTLEGGGVGGVASATLGAGGEAVRAGLRGLRNAVPGIMREANGARVSAATMATQPQMREMDRTMPGGIPGMADALRRQNLTGGTTESILRRAEPLLQPAGARIGATLDAVSTPELLSHPELSTRILPADIMQRTTTNVTAPLRTQRAPDADAAANTIERYFMENLGDVPQGWAPNEIRPIQAGLRGQADYHIATPNATRDAWQGVYSQTRNAVEDAVERGGRQLNNPEMLPQYRQDKLDYQALLNVMRFAQARLAGQGSNRVVSLTDNMAAGAGAVAGGPIMAGAAWLGNKLLRGREKSLYAGAMETIARLAQTSPERLGRYAAPVQRALQQGPAEFAATHLVLSQTQPEYRQLSTPEETEYLEQMTTEPTP